MGALVSRSLPRRSRRRGRREASWEAIRPILPKGVDRGRRRWLAPAALVRLADADAAIALVRGIGRYIVEFTGVSDSEYEDPGAVEGAVAEGLDEFEPTSVVICAGATPEGVGAVYPIAKQRGFTTIGIVSAMAEKAGARFSSSVGTVYVIADDSCGGLGADGELSPTSSAMVGSATR